MLLALLFLYLTLNMFRMLIHPSSGACDLFVELFHGLCCSGSLCVGVTLWFGCGGVVSLCRLKHCFSDIKLVSLYSIYDTLKVKKQADEKSLISMTVLWRYTNLTGMKGC